MRVAERALESSAQLRADDNRNRRLNAHLFIPFVMHGDRRFMPLVKIFFRHFQNFGKRPAGYLAKHDYFAADVFRHAETERGRTLRPAVIRRKQMFAP